MEGDNDGIDAMAGCLPDKICGSNTDDIFAYAVPKTVLIRDRRLGLIKIIFMGLIALYILFYQILYNLGYIQLLAPSGTTSLSLQGPTLPVCDILEGDTDSCNPPGGHRNSACCPDAECAVQYDIGNYTNNKKPACVGAEAKPECFRQCTGPPCDPTAGSDAARADGSPGGVCYSNFKALQHIEYCTQSGNFSRKLVPSGDSAKNFNCTFWDGARTGVSTGSANTLITSRVTSSVDEHHASPDAPSAYPGGKSCGCADVGNTSSCADGAYNASGNYICPAMWHSYNKTTQFVAQVEDFTLLVKHSVEQDTMGYAATASRMFGWIEVATAANGDAGAIAMQNALCAREPSARVVSYNGTGSLTDAAPCLIAPNSTSNQLDYFRLSTMLQAAGIDLDQRLPGDNAPMAHTIRYNGIQIVLNIDYTNYRPFYGVSNNAPPGNNGAISYVYKVTRLDSTAKIETDTYMSYPAVRATLNRHGVEVFVVQGGLVAKSSFAALTITLTTSLTFLALASLIVKVLAERFLEDKALYSAQMYEKSPDYVSVSQHREELSAMSDEQLRRHCRKLGQSWHGDRPRLVLAALDAAEPGPDDAKNMRWCACTGGASQCKPSRSAQPGHGQQQWKFAAVPSEGGTAISESGSRHRDSSTAALEKPLLVGTDIEQSVNRQPTAAASADGTYGAPSPPNQRV